jgi:hypothetical protein
MRYTVLILHLFYNQFHVRGFTMRRTILLTVCLCISMILSSQQASASLVAGTYGAAEGVAQECQGIQEFTALGETDSITSSQGIYSGHLTGPTVQNGSLYTVYGGSGTINFTFVGDGNPYSADLTGYTTYNLSSEGYPINLVTIGHGMITTPGYQNWAITFKVYNGTETFNNLTGWNYNSSYPSNVLGITYLNQEYTLTPVPIPGALWLLGSGLLGLIGIKRKLS